MPKARFTLSKQDCARRQLAAAIRLVLDPQGDPVAAHTLAAAAQGILRDGLRAAGLGSIIRDILPKEGKGRDWNDILNEQQNFLKHGGRDFNRTLEFAPFLTHMFLVDASDMWMRLTKSTLNETALFLMWFGAAYPECMLPNPALAAIKAQHSFRDLDFLDLEALHIVLRQMPFGHAEPFKTDPPGPICLYGFPSDETSPNLPSCS